ncbi:YjbH domain-containing protein [Vogesella indigofera]|uniref:YjbH domain-containing protein n=1 Tax=Vogesella indigofera TaxID=45465 RepID=UPI00234EC76E|nr:YjbH domain-containing protein [Vogesella indigofera]MDC7700873.1 YjbH domain-containing protein [Vogesella indigofera]
MSKSFALLSSSIPFLICRLAFGTPNLSGQDGYINMPSAYAGEDGTWSIGYSYDKPYSSLWTSVTILPALQMTARYVGIAGIAGFDNQQYGGNYGRYKDKVFDAKLQLLPEGEYTPAIAVGRTDLFGTGRFRGEYVTASKKLDDVEATVGVGTNRIDGPFAGVRWTPSQNPNWALLAEYDANDYQKDFRASETFAKERTPGIKAGVEYRWGWLSMQAAYQRSHSSLNAMVNIPLNEREFVPKIQEPSYFAPKEIPVRPSAEEWRTHPEHAQALQRVLQKQDYTLISISYRSGTLTLNLGNSRISDVGRAVGRAVRTALYYAPRETRTIKVTYTELDLPVATYEFFDMAALSDYLAGKISRERFKEFVLVRSANPHDRIAHSEDKGPLATGLSDEAGLSILLSEDGDVVQLRKQDSLLNRFKVAPKLAFYFNDPSGALHYDLSLASNIDRRLGEGVYLNAGIGATVLEDVSDVSQASNSLLPHVRSDVAEYKRGNRVKLFKAVLSQYYKPATNWYARASAGLYEEMFSGVGGQVLFVPPGQRWAADLSVDAVRQRDVDGWFGMRDYQTVTSLASLHYRLPYGTTATLRAGRFLAKDNGVRLEFKRRFRSGIEIGAWYTYTNGNDITSPGTLTAPYHDKGIFFSIPLDAMLTVDSRSKGSFSMSPWTRDVGQMVASPGDLYGIVEGDEQQVQAFDGLGNFAEHLSESEHPAISRPVERYNPWPRVRLRLDDSAAALPEVPALLKGSLLVAGAVGVASLSDKRWGNFISNHEGNSLLKRWDSASSIAPWLGVGAAGAAMMLGDDRLSNTGLIALQSAAVAGGSSLLIKQAVNRSRPEADNGHWTTQHAGQSRSDSSFPSNHAAVAFAVATPFAEEYGAPWLYGVAAAASLGRTAQRQHWLSDTVAGGLLGYAAGKWLWKAQRQEGRYQTGLNLGPDQIGVTVKKSY